jgi:biopolymer transport protein ExbB
MMLLAVPVFAGQDFDAAAATAATDYSQRVQKASEQLTAVRQKIVEEKAPVLKAIHAAEERIVAAEAETTRIETGQEQAKERRRDLQKEHEAVQKNLNYASTLARDAAVAVQDGLTPGEDQVLGEPLKRAIQQFDQTAKMSAEQATVDALDILLRRMETSVGGYQAPGRAILVDTNEVVEGTYAFVGPDAFFRSTDGKVVGIARAREGATYPFLHALSEWKPADADAFFRAQRGTMMADSTGGKALRLKETKGTIVEHIERGGVVSYAILLVGLTSLVLVLSKVYDLFKLEVDEPEEIETFLRQLGRVSPGHRAQLLSTIRSATRDLFTTGINSLHEPKQILEERLWAVLMRLRLHYERRLPLLAVIAVAAPLMGLLGTVTGMVRTFALITVFGTGNAGKLASGISEVLVATELGLIVAIPTLVAHGFLSNRLQKKLSLLERYALEFSTAAQSMSETEKEEAAV